MELFGVLEQEFGNLPIIAENLGVITPEVEAIRETIRFPRNGAPAICVR